MALRSISAGGALLALALTACSGGQPDAGGAPASSETEAAPAPVETAAPEALPSAEATPEAAPTAVPSAAVEAAAKTAAAPIPAKPTAPEVVKVAAVAAAPPAAFGRCAVCHTADKGGEDKIGPNLYGVYGKAAGKGSYAFSEEFKSAGLVLNEATLHKWLENPRALVPGNRMSFPGIKDPAKRQEIIDYLKQQS